MTTDLITQELKNQAMTFPDRVDTMLAEVRTLEGRKDILDRAAAMQHYVERLKAGIEIEKPIAVGVLKIKAGLGELMPAKNGRPLKDDKNPASDTGFNSHTKAAYRKLAANKDKIDKYAESVDDVPTQGGFIRWCIDPHVKNNTGKVEWYTPSEYIEMARRVMGGIDLDPASTAAANKTVQATKFYTAETDGLSKEWFGRIWMNPPYANGLIGKFISKLSDEIASGRVSQAVVVVNNATDTQWFVEFASSMTMLCFKTGRIAFVNEEGMTMTGALQGQVFGYYGKRKKAFASAFAREGICAEVVQ